MLCELGEEASAEVAGNDLEFYLALFELVDERLGLAGLLLQLLALVEHLLEFYRSLKISRAYH